MFSTAGLGSLSIVAAAVRYFFVYSNLKNTDNGFIEQYHAVLGIVCLEVTFAFAGFCLPAFRVLRFKRVAANEHIEHFPEEGSDSSPSTANERTLVNDDSIALCSARRESAVSPVKDYKRGNGGFPERLE